MKEIVLRLAMLATSQADSKEWSLTMDNIVSPHDDLKLVPFVRNGEVHWRKSPTHVSVYPTTGKKYCPSCEVEKDIQVFISRTGKLYVYCPACRNKKQRDRYGEQEKARNREKSLKRSYGITSEEYEAMFLAQFGVCAICGHGPGKNKKLVVDHCHKSNQVRALLCDACNRMIGDAKDNPKVLANAIKYLKEHGC